MDTTDTTTLEQRSSQAQTPDIDLEALRDAQALQLREISTGAYLSASIGNLFNHVLSPTAYPAYRDKLLEDCGNPEDPIERMLIEQLTLAHHNIGRLHAKSGMADDCKVAVAYAGAATRLLAEFRRCAVALEDYRAKRTDRILGGETKGTEIPKHDGDRASTTGDDNKEGLDAHSNARKARSPGRNGSVPKKDSQNGKEANTTEVPQCLKDRMSPIPTVLPRESLTGSNGRD